MPVFREAIAADFSRRRGVEVGPDRVVVTPGAKPVMAFALMALAGPGDEVIVPDPGFPIYESMTRFVGATPVPIPLAAGATTSGSTSTSCARWSRRARGCSSSTARTTPPGRC